MVEDILARSAIDADIERLRDHLLEQEVGEPASRTFAPPEANARHFIARPVKSPSWVSLVADS